MAESNESPRRQGVSEAELREVLDRAIELERTREVLPIAEVERIAVEAGIDPGAVAIALNELFERREMALPSGDRPVITAQPGDPGSLVSHPSAPAVTTVLGAVLGGLTMATFPQDETFLLGLAVLFVASGILASLNRKDGSQRGFQVQLATLWAAFAFMMTIGLGPSASGLVFLAGCWLVTALLGGGFIEFDRRDELTTTAPKPAS